MRVVVALTVAVALPVAVTLIVAPTVAPVVWLPLAMWRFRGTGDTRRQWHMHVCVMEP